MRVSEDGIQGECEPRNLRDGSRERPDHLITQVVSPRGAEPMGSRVSDWQSILSTVQVASLQEAAEYGLLAMLSDVIPQPQNSTPKVSYVNTRHGQSVLSM